MSARCKARSQIVSLPFKRGAWRVAVARQRGDLFGVRASVAAVRFCTRASGRRAVCGGFLAGARRPRPLHAAPDQHARLLTCEDMFSVSRRLSLLSGPPRKVKIRPTRRPLMSCPTGEWMSRSPTGYKKYEKLYNQCVSEPHGPIKIAANRQIVLPKALTDRLHLQPGDMVYALQSDSEPHSLVIVPVERVTEWIRLGRTAEGQQAADQTERMPDDGQSLGN